ncbi:uncharacterized protein DUF1579 [Pontibacter ummariensis]|uniref:DUF1579 domain-containing protein n=1 Tax=Pontibacter ummariensis TaxID=1610492 RepID=A0A239BE48_9BACT|nr:DUF1579 family protein [Pontibacter ummariensis]PRY16485.1 uncharacterized protein DUF1579 [Pontibacter ummariensis]SNS06009.1 Protein of unknown function [Pontibacter ummariensis]
MKKVITSLLAAVLLVLAAPATQAQENNPLSSTEAYRLLRSIAGNWLVTHYVWQPESQTFVEEEGEAVFSRAYQGSYVHEKSDVAQTDGSVMHRESFLGFSPEKGHFELIQSDETGKNSLLLIGQWHPEFNALTFTPAKTDQPEDLKGKFVTQYVYLFLPEGNLLKIVRTIDEKGNYLIRSQDYYTPQRTAGL